MCDQIIQRKLYVGESHMGVSVYFPEDFDFITAIEYGIKRNENQKQYVYHATLANDLIERIENGFFIKPVQMNFPATNYVAEIRVTTASQHDYAIYFERIHLLKGVVDSMSLSPSGSFNPPVEEPFHSVITRDLTTERITVEITEDVFNVQFAVGKGIKGEKGEKGDAVILDFFVNENMELQYTSVGFEGNFQINNKGELIVE